MKKFETNHKTTFGNILWFYDCEPIWCKLGPAVLMFLMLFPMFGLYVHGVMCTLGNEGNSLDTYMYTYLGEWKSIILDFLEHVEWKYEIQ